MSSHDVNWSRGSSLYLLRHASHLTQADLAVSAGVTRETVSNIEGGRQRPQPETAAALARVFGVPADVLFPSLNHVAPAGNGRDGKASDAGARVAT